MNHDELLRLLEELVVDRGVVVPRHGSLVREIERLLGGRELPPVGGHALRFVLGNERALEPDGVREVLGQVEHVPVSEELLGAVRVENRARVGLGRHLESEPAREIRLDQPRDDVDRRPLRRENEVDSHGPGHLREPRDRRIDLVSHRDHDVGELVDDRHVVRKPREPLLRFGMKRAPPRRPCG